MRKTTLTTLFNFSFSVLTQLAENVLVLINRDGTVLAVYGVDNGMVTFISTQKDTLINFPTDVELLQDVSDATEAKDKLADDVKEGIRDIMVRARNAFGNQSAKFRKFGTKDIKDMSDFELFFCAERVVRVATGYLSLLTDKGLTQQIIDDFETLAGDFKTAIVAKKDAVYLRDNATEDRIEIANELYSKLVEVCDYGKTYWAGKSEANYNDYVIYNTPDGQLPDPTLYGAAHGNVSIGSTAAPVVNGKIYFDGVAAPVNVNADKLWAYNLIPIACTKIRATADSCHDYEADISVVAGQDIIINIVLTALEILPPNPS